jgi:diadenosine tetraphosphate (Ap4A) HIT family hydrolase
MMGELKNNVNRSYPSLRREKMLQVGLMATSVVTKVELDVDTDGYKWKHLHMCNVQGPEHTHVHLLCQPTEPEP